MSSKGTSKQAVTGANRQAAYASRMRDAGFRRLSVWVPDTRKEEFDYAIVGLQDRWIGAGLYPERPPKV
jgi:hypothetical protein